MRIFNKTAAALFVACGVVAALFTVVVLAGSVTAGNINGVTATFGGSGGEVTLNSDGISIKAGTNMVNRYKFDNGSYIQGRIGNDAILVLNSGSNGVWMQLNNGGLAILDADAFAPAAGNGNSHFDLGSSGGPWEDLHMAGYAYIATLTSGTVCADNGTLLMCGAPAPDPELVALHRELADLRAQVAELGANR